MNKKKLFFAIPNLNGGGAERVFINIVNNMDHQKYEISIVVGELVGPYVKYIDCNIKVYELGKVGAIDSIIPLLKLLRDQKPDVIFSTLGFVVSSNLAVLLSLRKIKTISRFGNTLKPFLDDIKSKGNIYFFLQKKIHYLVILLSDLIIVQSDYMKRDAIDLFNLNGTLASKMIKINNLVDVDLVNSKSKEDHIYFRKKIFLNAIHFISVGRIEYQKGYDILIKAFFNLRSKLQNATLTIVGEGSERSKIEALIKELNLDDSVFLSGYSDNPYVYIKKSDIYVSSSRYEGFSNTILESLILGVPVVATNCPSGVREIVNEGYNGWLVNMEGDLISNLSSKMITATKEYKSLDMVKESQLIASKYCLKEIVKKYDELINN
jgi:glycosyltransferase involved in cell wall biosynthesis